MSEEMSKYSNQIEMLCLYVSIKKQRNTITELKARITATLKMLSVQIKWKLVTLAIQEHKYDPFSPRYGNSDSIPCWSIKSVERQCLVLHNTGTASSYNRRITESLR